MTTDGATQYQAYAAVHSDALSLSQYQRDCAKPGTVNTPQTYKQGPVVRLDRDVRDVQKWAGTNLDGKGAASMNRETRTALRDKIAEYQEKNGIEAKTPGELNKDTLDKMRQDKTLPQGLTDSLQKVNPYYKPGDIARITCVTKPGEDSAKPTDATPVTVAPVTVPPVELPPAELSPAALAAATDKIMSPTDRKSPHLENHDQTPEQEARQYAAVSANIANTVQQQSNLPQTGKLDDATISAIKTDPKFEGLEPTVDQWKSSGLIDKDGSWDQARHAQLMNDAAAPNSAAPIKATGADGYMPEGKLSYQGSAQTAFEAATNDKPQPQKDNAPKTDAPAPVESDPGPKAGLRNYRFLTFDN